VRPPALGPGPPGLPSVRVRRVPAPFLSPPFPACARAPVPVRAFCAVPCVPPLPVSAVFALLASGLPRPFRRLACSRSAFVLCAARPSLLACRLPSPSLPGPLGRCRSLGVPLLLPVAPPCGRTPPDPPCPAGVLRPCRWLVRGLSPLLFSAPPRPYRFRRPLCRLAVRGRAVGSWLWPVARASCPSRPCRFPPCRSAPRPGPCACSPVLLPGLLSRPPFPRASCAFGALSAGRLVPPPALGPSLLRPCASSWPVSLGLFPFPRPRSAPARSGLSLPPRSPLGPVGLQPPAHRLAAAVQRLAHPLPACVPSSPPAALCCTFGPAHPAASAPRPAWTAFPVAPPCPFCCPALLCPWGGVRGPPPPALPLGRPPVAPRPPSPVLLASFPAGPRLGLACGRRRSLPPAPVPCASGSPRRRRPRPVCVLPRWPRRLPAPRLVLWPSALRYLRLLPACPAGWWSGLAAPLPLPPPRMPGWWYRAVGWVLSCFRPSYAPPRVPAGFSVSRPPGARTSAAMLVPPPPDPPPPPPPPLRAASPVVSADGARARPGLGPCSPAPRQLLPRAARVPPGARRRPGAAFLPMPSARPRLRAPPRRWCPPFPAPARRLARYRVAFAAAPRCRFVSRPVLAALPRGSSGPAAPTALGPPPLRLGVCGPPRLRGAGWPLRAPVPVALSGAGPAFSLRSASWLLRVPRPFLCCLSGFRSRPPSWCPHGPSPGSPRVAVSRPPSAPFVPSCPPAPSPLRLSLRPRAPSLGRLWFRLTPGFVSFVTLPPPLSAPAAARPRTRIARSLRPFRRAPPRPLFFLLGLRRAVPVPAASPRPFGSPPPAPVPSPLALAPARRRPGRLPPSLSPFPRGGLVRQAAPAAGPLFSAGCACGPAGPLVSFLACRRPAFGVRVRLASRSALLCLLAPPPWRARTCALLLGPRRPPRLLTCPVGCRVGRPPPAGLGLALCGFDCAFHPVRVPWPCAVAWPLSRGSLSPSPLVPCSGRSAVP